MSSRSARRFAFAVAVLAAYLGAYAAASSRARPAANMAYFVYSENPAADDLCSRFFLPVYLAHRAAWRALDRPFVRHSSDRIAPPGASAPL